jgi:hypothetical protein
LKAAPLPKVCLDLNVWCGAFIARRLGREGTATIALTDAVRLGQSPRGPIALVISWGMLERLSRIAEKCRAVFRKKSC